MMAIGSFSSSSRKVPKRFFLDNYAQNLVSKWAVLNGFERDLDPGNTWCLHMNSSRHNKKMSRPLKSNVSYMLSKASSTLTLHLHLICALRSVPANRIPDSLSWTVELCFFAKLLNRSVHLTVDCHINDFDMNCRWLKACRRQFCSKIYSSSGIAFIHFRMGALANFRMMTPVIHTWCTRPQKGKSSLTSWKKQIDPTAKPSAEK